MSFVWLVAWGRLGLREEGNKFAQISIAVGTL